MGGARVTAKPRARLAVALILLALAARMIVPAGFMPMATAAGAVIVPCSGSGPMAMAMAGARHGGSHDEGDRADHGCPFAALADLATGGHAPPEVSPPRTFVAPLRIIPLVALTTTLPERLRPPLRAPPR